MGAPAQTTPQGGFNLQQAVPQALGRAMQTTAMGTAYQPQQVQGTSYQAAQAGQVGPVTAQQIQAGQLGTTPLSPYMNPYESQVVGQTLSDLERARQMQQNVLGAQATQARAFGGSRAGVAQAETNRAFAEQAARTAGQLRQAGFTQAQQAAQQDIASQLAAQQANQQAALQAGISGAGIARDIGLANLQAQQQARQFGATQGMTAQQLNQMAGLQGAQQRLAAGQQLGNLANLGFGMGQSINQQLAQQGALQQALQQQVLNNAMQQYQGFTGAPVSGLQALLGAITGGNVGQGTGTQQRNLGLIDYVNAIGQFV